MRIHWFRVYGRPINKLNIFRIKKSTQWLFVGDPYTEVHLLFKRDESLLEISGQQISMKARANLPRLVALRNQSEISVNLKTFVTSWSYCSRGKWRLDFLNDHSHRFEVLRHTFKTFHEAFTIFLSGQRIESHEVSREIFSTFCVLFLLLNKGLLWDLKSP